MKVSLLSNGLQIYIKKSDRLKKFMYAKTKGEVTEK